MNYDHRFTVDAPVAKVAAFHRVSASMAEITPPLMIVRMHRAPVEAQAGDEIDFTLWMGPLPVRWTVRIEQVDPAGFTDRQIRGPFAEWVHRHEFVAAGQGRTAVHDVVEATLHRDPLRWMLGQFMWLGLPALFAYRAWQTKRLLER